jgi:hypothetical protein
MPHRVTSGGIGGEDKRGIRYEKRGNVWSLWETDKDGYNLEQVGPQHLVGTDSSYSVGYGGRHHDDNG